jgi:hypothetical protein
MHSKAHVRPCVHARTETQLNGARSTRTDFTATPRERRFAPPGLVTRTRGVASGAHLDTCN